MKIQTFQGGYDNNFFYLLSANNEAAVIDCFDTNLALDYLEKNNLVLKYIISTHNHFDHTEANHELKQRTKAKLVMYKSNQCDLTVKEEDELKLAESVLKILHTPGHTPDSICILADNQFLFTGDTLFVGGIGRIFYPQGKADYPQTIKKIMELPDDIIIYPGHHYGATPTSTIKQEKETNPFVK